MYAQQANARSTRGRPAPMTAEELADKEDDEISVRDMMDLLISMNSRMSGIDDKLQSIEDRLKG